MWGRKIDCQARDSRPCNQAILAGRGVFKRLITSAFHTFYTWVTPHLSCLGMVWQGTFVVQGSISRTDILLDGADHATAHGTRLPILSYLNAMQLIDTRICWSLST